MADKNRKENDICEKRNQQINIFSTAKSEIQIDR